jgi:hypothetical protein
VTDYARSEAKAAARDRFRGLWAATTTPFDDAGPLRNVISLLIHQP